MIAKPRTDQIHYPTRTIARAWRAMQCAPFTAHLFVTMMQHSVSLSAIAGKAGRTAHYTTTVLSELTAESELLWLIQVGVLRREVDGQGLTNSFRLTPLGRQLTEQRPNAAACFRLTWRDRLQNLVDRWLRLPF